MLWVSNELLCIIYPNAIRGLMALYDSRPKDMPVGAGKDVPESLESAFRRLNRIATLYNSRFDQVDVGAISPFPARGVFSTLR